jgi:hypothetical protein
MEAGWVLDHTTIGKSSRETDVFIYIVCPEKGVV